MRPCPAYHKERERNYNDGETHRQQYRFAHLVMANDSSSGRKQQSEASAVCGSGQLKVERHCPGH
jgi:hypothetical protein